MPVSEVGRLSVEEVRGWVAYERMYGPLLVQDRIDIGLAKLAFYLVSMLGQSKRTLKIEDFLPPYMLDVIRRSDDGRQAAATILSWVPAEELAKIGAMSAGS